MPARHAVLVGVVFVGVSIGLTTTAARIADRAPSADRQSAATAPQQSAAASMVVYKSAT